MFPREVLTAARAGLMLWFENVLPSLLPFMIATHLLISLGFARFLGGLLRPVMRIVFGLPGEGGFALLMGLSSGYPLGAKTVADLLRDGMIKKRHAQHLLGFCNNAGPLFIVGVIGIGMFSNARIGYLLWAGHVFGAIVLGILLRGKYFLHHHDEIIIHSKQNNHKMELLTDADISIAKVLGDAVKNAMEAITFVGGLIIFFSVVAHSISIILPLWMLPTAVGLLEITNGIQAAAQQGGLAAIILTSALIGFGGLSVHAQAAHFLMGTGLRLKHYLICKILHALLATGITLFLYKIFV